MGTGSEHPQPSTAAVTRVARVTAGAAVTALCTILVWWWGTGGTWLIVSTPSMGRYAPVGTLLWVTPAELGDLRVGDVVTFTTPETGGTPRPWRTYTHRVVDTNPDGSLVTKGDANGGRDPWRVRQQDLVGRVAAAWPGVGWLVKAVPLLVFGGLGWWVVTAALASSRSRAPLRVLGAAVLAAVAVYVHNPLFGATQLSFIPLGPPGARATYVATGLLPVRLEADGADPVLVRSGEIESITVPHEDPDGRFQVRVVPTIPWSTWLVIVMACLAPAGWSLIVGTDAPPPARRRLRLRAP